MSAKLTAFKYVSTTKGKRKSVSGYPLATEDKHKKILPINSLVCLHLQRIIRNTKEFRTKAKKLKISEIFHFDKVKKEDLDMP